MTTLLRRRWRPGCRTTWSWARCTNTSFVMYRLNPEFRFPQALAPWVPHYLELGPLYKLYMVALTVFATNAINILAGVNGLEVRLLQPLICPAAAYACRCTAARTSGHSTTDANGAHGCNDIAKIICVLVSEQIRNASCRWARRSSSHVRCCYIIWWSWRGMPAKMQ
jgi:Glycosyl transferase family 4